MSRPRRVVHPGGARTSARPRGHRRRGRADLGRGRHAAGRGMAVVQAAPLRLGLDAFRRQPRCSGCRGGIRSRSCAGRRPERPVMPLSQSRAARDPVSSCARRAPLRPPSVGRILTAIHLLRNGHRAAKIVLAALEMARAEPPFTARAGPERRSDGVARAAPQRHRGDAPDAYTGAPGPPGFKERPACRRWSSTA
jgi:hypothetical protein